MKLSPQQQQAYDLIMAFKENDQKRFVLAGYAGTGKSTMSRIIADEFGDTSFCAYTGKAANVLREKGCSATTIHGALYTLISSENEPEPRFALDPEADIKYSDLVIVDEYSMLDEELITDIESLAKKVLYLGDPFQLPPVGGECSLKPDFFLEEIHRQALDSNILRYATDVRQGKTLKQCHHDDFVYTHRTKVAPEDYDRADQIIVGYNRTRIAWNKRFRLKMGFEGQPLPCAGDKMICTRNSRKLGLFNGMIGDCNSNAREVDYQTIAFGFKKYNSINVWDGNFKGREGYPKGKQSFLERFDYAYAITCHKSQGSEFDDVLIYNQPIGKGAIEKQRWLYTALTRSKKKVTLVQP